MDQKTHVTADDLQLIIGMALSGNGRETVLLPEVEPASDGVGNWRPVVAPRAPGDVALIDQLRREYEVLGWPSRIGPAVSG